MRAPGSVSAHAAVCTLTLAGADVADDVQVLQNGCFVLEPMDSARKAPAILACGLKTLGG